ncbi:MAG: DUF1292 domain-containing protein [Clostridia bacterium]|nr:DUF1292 domain-containing protein [Clostridia bacterium]
MAKDLDKDFEELEDDMIVLYDEATDKDEKFYVLEIMDYKDKQFVILQPAEHLEDIDDNELLIYELGDEDDEENFLIPIEDEKLLQEVFDRFMHEAEEYEKALKESMQNPGCAGCSGCGDANDCGDCSGCGNN